MFFPQKFFLTRHNTPPRHRIIVFYGGVMKCFDSESITTEYLGVKCILFFTPPHRKLYNLCIVHCFCHFFGVCNNNVGKDVNIMLGKCKKISKFLQILANFAKSCKNLQETHTPPSCLHILFTTSFLSSNTSTAIGGTPFCAVESS